ncbi:Dolichyl-diphosphooligosaccharide--protein glycosyltransferase subunit 1 [Entamoeba marina]
MSFIFFLCVALALAHENINSVKVSTLFSPFPNRQLTFQISDSNPFDHYQFTLPKNESTQMGSFYCRSAEKDLKFEGIENEKAFEVNVYFELTQSITFQCDYLYHDSLYNLPQQRKLTDEYKFLFTTHLCPIPMHGDLKCTAELLSNGIHKISLSKQPSSEKNQRYEYSSILLHPTDEFEFITFHFKTHLNPIEIGRIKKVVNINDDGIDVEMQFIDVKNTGATLIDEFSRIDYNYNTIDFKGLIMEIEPSASNIEYRDSTGLITTYEVEHQTKHTKIQLEPRYPLLGGWKTSFDFNYHYPTQQSIQTIGGQTRALFPIKIDHEGISKQVEVDIVLPEGATITTINYPTKSFMKHTISEQSSFGTFYKKTVVTFIIDYIEPSHIQDSIEIYYKENPTAALVKQLFVGCLASSILVVFLLYAKIINN